MGLNRIRLGTWAVSVLVAAGLVLIAVRTDLPAHAAVAQTSKPTTVKSERMIAVDYGPFLSTSIIRHKPAGAVRGDMPDPEPDIVAHKGIAIHLGGKGP